MKTMRMRISPDGSKYMHVYDDSLRNMDKSLGEMVVMRASDVFFDNEVGRWKIRILSTKEVLPAEFNTRAEALAYEVDYIQNNMEECAPIHES